MGKICYWSNISGVFDKEVQDVIQHLQLVKNNKETILFCNKEQQYDDKIEIDRRYEIYAGDFDGHIVLFTSGTTGEPKPVYIHYENAIKNKRGTGTPNDKWLLTYAPTRWAGMSVLIHVEKIGALHNLIVPQSFAPEHILEKFNLATHISLTPSLFRKLMIIDDGQLASANIQQLTFGGEYATQKVLDDARKLWPNAKITHIYASTEFGDICSASDGLEGFHKNKLDKWNYKLAPNSELLLQDCSTGDMWKEENDRLYFLGRITETINVGGAKVSQTTIENVTNSINGVNECKVYPIDNALLGQVVGLNYVGDIEPIALKKELLKLLPKYAVPAKFNKVEFIELTSAGKITRK